MSGFATYVENKALAWFTGTSMGSSPAGLYIALSTTQYADDGTGGTEVSGNGYARTACTFGSTSAGSPSGRQFANSSTVSFPTATGSQGTPGYFAVYDASTGGNMLWSGTIASPIAISSGITATFAVGAFSLKLSGFSNYSENKFLGWLVGTSPGSSPAGLYAALSTTQYAEDGTGGTEVSGNGYARTAGAFGSTGAGSPAGRRISNSAAVTFPAATGSQGTPGYFAVFDASTSGNQLWQGAITTPIAISSGITAQFATGALTLNLD